MKRYQRISQLLAAIANCKGRGNTEWLDRHTEELSNIMRDTAPHGSGIDNGTALDESATPEKLVFTFSYHHMDENGMYDGWTEHVLTVVPSLQFDIMLHFSGRNRNDLKDYLHEVYHNWLTGETT